MNVHAITFRIHHDHTYQKRWQSVVDAIRRTTTSKYWDETTSFALIASPNDAIVVATEILLGSDLDSSKDLLLVINLSGSGALDHWTIGKVDDQEQLAALMAMRARATPAAVAPGGYINAMLQGGESPAPRGLLDPAFWKK